MERLIKTEADYEKALAIIDTLMDVEEGNNAAERLEYWVKMVEIYEEKHYPIPKPQPLAAIQFAMEQQGLTRRDLEPFIGCKSKVSEVLSGKRPLSLDMIRRLHAGLGIPLDTLAQEAPLSEQGIDWSLFPIKEMVERGWIKAASEATKVEEEIKGWIDNAGLATTIPAYCARSSTRLGVRGDFYGMLAWVCGVQNIAAALPLPEVFSRDALTRDFFRGMFELSAAPDGPFLARDYLAKSGIHLVVLQHFRKTYMDGAALFTPSGNAVVGLTLRHDRIDNFWFTLGHELAHLALGHVEPGGFVVDDLDARNQDETERAANELAMEMMVPDEVWGTTPPAERATLEFVLLAAARLKINPAIVAGRVRKETGNYKQFAKMIGSGKVRQLFPEW